MKVGRELYTYRADSRLQVTQRGRKLARISREHHLNLVLVKNAICVSNEIRFSSIGEAF